MLENLFGKGKGRILVADDEESLRSLVVDILEAQGYQVESVADGQAAVDRLKAKAYDLLIMDVHMPRLEGPQVLEVVRLLPGGKDLPVIMMTSESSMETFMQVFELKACSFIPKPFPMAKLVAEVEAALAKKPGQA